MPAKQRLGLDDDKRISPVEPARQQDHHEPVGWSETAGLDLRLLVEAELFAQEEILGLRHDERVVPISQDSPRNPGKQKKGNEQT